MGNPQRQHVAGRAARGCVPSCPVRSRPVTAARTPGHSTHHQAAKVHATLGGPWRWQVLSAMTPGWWQQVTGVAPTGKERHTDRGQALLIQEDGVWVGLPPASPVLAQSELQAQRWLLRPCSRVGVAPAAGQNPDREAHHTPQLGRKGTPPSCFTPRSFHHLSNNGSAPGPRNQLPRLERQGPEGQSRSKAAQISRAHTPGRPVPAPRGCVSRTPGSGVRSSSRPAPGELDLVHLSLAFVCQGQGSAALRGRPGLPAARLTVSRLP